MTNLLIQSIPGDVLARLAWALVIIIGGVALFRLVNYALLARAQRSADLRPADDSPGDTISLAASGKPSIVYFTTPECAPCKTIQRPALRALQERLGDRLDVIEVDARERPDLASRWGVLSVPTTFIIDSGGTLRHVNHGVTRAEKLLQQVEGL